MAAAMRGARWVFVGAATALGCASTVAGAHADRDGAVSDVPPTAELSVQVTLGPRVPAAVGVDVPVRVQFEGVSFEARTDATGTARFVVDRARRWDVTAALEGYAAVSVLSVPATERVEVFLRAISPTRLRPTHRVTLTVGLRGRSGPGSAVIVDGAAGSAVARNDTQELSLPEWPGAPQFRVFAVEVDDATRFLNAAISEPMARPTADARVVVTLPTPALTPTQRVLHVEFPQVGLVAASRVTPEDSSVVGQWKVTDIGYGVVPVGRATLDRPTPAGEASWRLESFEGALAPAIVSTSLRTTSPAVRATVTTEPPFDGLVPAFGALGALQSSTRGGPPSLTADLASWDRGAFQVVAEDGTAVWEGYTFGRESPWVDRPIPVLPGALTLPLLLGQPAAFRLRACVLRDRPSQGAPWRSMLPAMQFRALLTVCEADGSPLGG